MRRKMAVAVAALTCAFYSGTVLEGEPDRSDHKRRHPGEASFQRIATFPVINNYCPPQAPIACFNRATVAEIVAVSEDGNLLIYTDSANKEVGFVDITNPFVPSPRGTLAVGGEPTSVGVAGRYALVVVSTTNGDFAHPSGHLTIIDLRTRTIVPGLESIDLGGQPDSIAISPKKTYAAIVIENERDEDVNDGELPQAPAGKLVRVDLKPRTDPSKWTLKDISLTGFADIASEDPEPESVDINDNDIAVVTLQENNHIILVDLKTCVVVGDFSAGKVNLANVDTVGEDVINFNSSLVDVPREPDGVKWISDYAFATADEGDLHGGSRGFTVFDIVGNVLFRSASGFEYLAGRIGHYPEGRSENKGAEPEGVEYAKFDRDEFLFIGSERASFVGVYRLWNNRAEFVQALPGAVGPEGLLAIPHRKLFVSTGEEDDPEGQTFRASITIYKLSEDDPAYPTIVSKTGPNGTPVPWAALSGLAADPADRDLVYTVSDSAFAEGFFYRVDVSDSPAVITKRIQVTGAGGLDLEGVAVRSDGSLWLASEGTADGSKPNRLLAVNQQTGAVLQTVLLPAQVDARRTGSGVEGVAVTGKVGGTNENAEKVYVAFQREWSGDPARNVRVGVYDVTAQTWSFLYYPLDAVESPHGGWVGLSDLTSLGGGRFAVIERDNQAGANARIKRIYSFSVAGVTPQPDCAPNTTCNFSTVVKRLERDLIPYLEAPGGPVLEKIEGLALTKDGRTLIVTDNDGVDDSSGETQFIDLGRRVLP